MNEPILDGEVPAVLAAFVAGDGMVTEDVHRVAAEGAGFTCKFLF
jgi:hypothetical protein